MQKFKVYWYIGKVDGKVVAGFTTGRTVKDILNDCKGNGIKGGRVYVANGTETISGSFLQRLRDEKGYSWQEASEYAYELAKKQCEEQNKEGVV